jgi:hypothetical protein
MPHPPSLALAAAGASVEPSHHGPSPCRPSPIAGTGPKLNLDARLPVHCRASRLRAQGPAAARRNWYNLVGSVVQEVSMAGPKEPTAGAPRGRGRGGRGGPARASQRLANSGAVDRLLDALDDAMLAGQTARVEALSEQLWACRDDVPLALTERLRAGRARIPMLAFELLGSFAGEETPVYLMRIAQDPAVADIVRWGARRRAGWSEEEGGPERLAFLDSLREGDLTLALAVEQALHWSPPDGEILQEATAYLAALPPARRRPVIERLLAIDSPELTWFLNAAVHLDDPPVQRLVIEALARRRDRLAADALGRLAGTAGDAAIRREAAVAERRLRLHVVASGELADRAAPLLALDRVLASEIDGDGGQLLVVTRLWPHVGVGLMAAVFWNDQWGIKDAWGINRLPIEQITAGLLTRIAGSMTLVEIDLASARGILAAALDVNAATGQPLPPVFEIWAPYFRDHLPSTGDEAVTPIELSDELDEAAMTGLRRTGDLLDHPLFANWFFNPDDLLPLLLLTPPPSRGRLTERQYRPLIGDLVDATVRERLRGRLRRQAWLLDRRGDAAARDLALAAAAALRDRANLSKHPLLRAMVDRGLASLIGSFDAEAPL